jgi:hypothetical protein
LPQNKRFRHNIYQKNKKIKQKHNDGIYSQDLERRNFLAHLLAEMFARKFKTNS